jgi:hypothetical protein
MAAALVRDLAYRNRTALEVFLERRADELLPEFGAEFLDPCE